MEHRSPLAGLHPTGEVIIAAENPGRTVTTFTAAPLNLEKLSENKKFEFFIETGHEP
jgi:hypothetical protein